MIPERLGDGIESYEVLREQFEREWRRIAMEFVNGEIRCPKP